MQSATRFKEIGKHLCCWSRFHNQWKIDFDSYALKTPDGVLFFDPMRPAPKILKKLETLGEPIAIVLTNAHHDRDADWFRKRYQIQVYAHEKAKSDCDTKIDVLLLDGEKLPGGVKAIHLPGTTSSETAFYTKIGGGMILLGDALLNLPGKGLSLLPEQYIEDRRQALQSLRKLLDLKFGILTFAHGEPLVDNAKKRMATYLKRPGKKLL